MENAYSFAIGPVVISLSVMTTWGIMLVLTLIAWLSTRNLKLFPGAIQTVVESIVAAIDEAILAVAPEHGRLIMPFIASLWIFLTIANLVGLIPELHSPTRDLSVTSALAVLVLLPFHIISEFTRTLALAIRLFGNMMSLEMAAMLILLVAGFLAPIPILMLHIIEALVQAYIFGMLALIYLAGAIQSQQLNSQE
jgi:F-type H+-transporting ATPase subunit a